MANITHELTVAGTSVQQDAAGRFSLNDLHRAAGAEERHKPGNWLQIQQAAELVQELETAGIPAVSRVEGRNGGTFVARELVYAYAMWISPRFHLQVIRGYDALVAGAALGSNTSAGSPRTLGQLLAAQRQVQRLIDGIGASSNKAVQALLHELLASTCSALGVAAPALADLLAKAVPPAGAGNPQQGQLPGMQGGAA